MQNNRNLIFTFIFSIIAVQSTSLFAAAGNPHQRGQEGDRRGNKMMTLLRKSHRASLDQHKHDKERGSSALVEGMEIDPLFVAGDIARTKNNREHVLTDEAKAWVRLCEWAIGEGREGQAEESDF